MKYGVVLIIVATMLICVSCRNGHPNDEKDIDWSTLTEIVTNDELSSVIDSVIYIPLETNDSCLLGDITKCEQTDSFIYVLAEVYSGGIKELHQFDKKGHHVRKIGSRGVGPGEYGDIGTFAITGDTLLLFDDYSSTIKCYDMAGNYLCMESPVINPTGVTEICPLNGIECVLIRSNIGNFDSAIYSVIDVSDTLGIRPLASHVFDCRESIASVTASGQIGHWDEESILIVMPFSQELIKLDISSLQLSSAIAIKTENSIPNPHKNERLDVYKKRVNIKDMMMQIPLWACRSGKWLGIGFYMGGILWNLETNTGYHTLNGLDNKKIKDFPLAMWNVIGAYNDIGFICWMSAEEFISICSILPEYARCQPSKDISDAISCESNPILLLYVMK